MTERESVKRYGIDGDRTEGYVSYEDADDGPWVRYEDHAADRAELVARVEAAERARDEARHQRGEWAEALNGSDGFRERLRAAESKAASLLAEVERLNVRVRIEVQTRDDWVAAKESQLAAANALLDEALCWVGYGLGQRISAHLDSAQPASAMRFDELRVLDAVKTHYERSPGKLPEDVWRAYAELARRKAK